MPTETSRIQELAERDSARQEDHISPTEAQSDNGDGLTLRRVSKRFGSA